MKQSATRLLSTLLALCMALAMLPGMALASDTYFFDTPDGAFSFDFDKATGIITDFSSDVESVSLEIPATLGDTPVTGIGAHTFSGCSNLTSVTIPDSVTSIGDSAFSSCSSLTSVTIPASVTSIGNGAFSGCSGMTEIVAAPGNQNYASEDGVLFNEDKTELIAFPGAKSGAYAIPASVASIGDSAFMSCTNLISVTIPNSVTSIGARAFSMCVNLTSVTIPDSVTSIGEYAFSWCDSLTSVTIPASVTSIGGSAFYRCSSLTSVTISNGVTSIGKSAFSGCESLTSVTIPNSVTSIGEDAFDCCKLTSVTIPANVTSIGKGAFCVCRSLTSVTILDGVTSISRGAFEGCTALISITIPASVTSIGEYAFSGRNNLKDVYYSGLEEDWEKISIASEGNPVLEKAAVHYNSGGNNTKPDKPQEPNKPQETVYQISFDTGIESLTVSPMKTNANGKLTSLPRPTREGYIFDGWFTEQTGGTRITTDTIFAKNTTVFAHWTRLTSKPDGNGSSAGSSGGSSKPSIRPGSTSAKPDAPSTPAAPSAPSGSASSGFGDVPAGTWYAEAVNYAVTRGIMNGTGSDNFSPNATTTRAMLMTMLARLNGTDTEGGSNWYEKGMQWAKDKGISDGSNPNGSITREQLVTMLYRYQGSPAAEGSLDTFVDGSMVNDWAMDAMRWAVTNGIVQGSGGSINPASNATRAEVAAILMRFCQQFSV